jgi:hypothetical protein
MSANAANSSSLPATSRSATARCFQEIRSASRYSTSAASNSSNDAGGSSSARCARWTTTRLHGPSGASCGKVPNRASPRPPAFASAWAMPASFQGCGSLKAIVPAVGLDPELQRRGHGLDVGVDRGLVGLVPHRSGVIRVDALDEPAAGRSVHDQGGQAVVARADLLGPGEQPGLGLDAAAHAGGQLGGSGRRVSSTGTGAERGRVAVVMDIDDHLPPSRCWQYRSRGEPVWQYSRVKGMHVPQESLGFDGEHWDLEAPDPCPRGPAQGRGHLPGDAAAVAPEIAPARTTDPGSAGRRGRPRRPVRGLPPPAGRWQCVPRCSGRQQ